MATYVRLAVRHTRWLRCSRCAAESGRGAGERGVSTRSARRRRDPHEHPLNKWACDPRCASRRCSRRCTRESRERRGCGESESERKDYAQSRVCSRSEATTTTPARSPCSSIHILFLSSAFFFCSPDSAGSSCAEPHVDSSSSSRFRAAFARRCAAFAVAGGGAGGLQAPEPSQPPRAPLG